MSISESKVLFLMFWSVAMVDLKQQRNRVWECIETNKTNELEHQLSTLKFEESRRFFLCDGAVNYILIKNKNRFCLR